MNRKEFIDKLKAELSKLPAEEVAAAVEYYEEYFDEAGPDQEQEIIKELGGPKKAAAQIKSEYAFRKLDEDPKPTAKKGLSAVWWIIIGICSAPVSIPLAIAGVALAICVFIAVLCSIIGIFATIVGVVAMGVFFLAVGIAAIPAAFSTAMLFIGGGLMTLAVMAALGVGIVLGIRAAITAIVRGTRNRNDRKRAEQMASMAEQNQWKYKEVE